MCRGLEHARGANRADKNAEKLRGFRLDVSKAGEPVGLGSIVLSSCGQHLRPRRRVEHALHVHRSDEGHDRVRPGGSGAGTGCLHRDHPDARVCGMSLER